MPLGSAETHLVHHDRSRTLAVRNRAPRRCLHDLLNLVEPEHVDMLDAGEKVTIRYDELPKAGEEEYWLTLEQVKG